MGSDWENILGVEAAGDALAKAYDLAAADALYQDHPRSAVGRRVDPGDDQVVLPFDEA